MKLRYILTLLLMLCICASRADEGDTIRVTFNGGEAQVSIPSSAQVVANVEGAHVSLTSTTSIEEYVYALSGSTPDGSLTITGTYKLTLLLQGVNITSGRGAAIDVECGKRIAVIVANGTENWLTDCPTGVQKAALYFTGHPEFEGNGTLNVTGLVKHAIAAKEELKIKRSAGTINVLGAVGDGIHCGKGKALNEHNYFEMNGGVVNITNIGGDGIDSDDFGTMYITGGSVNVNVSGESVSGLKSDSTMTISGGHMNIMVDGNDSEGVRTNYDAHLLGGQMDIVVSGSGSKGIKSKDKANGMVHEGGRLTLGGSNITIYSYGSDLMNADSTETKIRAISADRTITRSAGDIEIFAYGSVHSPYHTDSTEVVTGGTLTIHRAPWPFYHGEFEHSMTAHVSAVLFSGLPILVSKDFAIGAFIQGKCVGVATDGYLRIHNLTTEDDIVTFRGYDFSTGEYYRLAANQPIRFSPYSTIGGPSAMERIVLRARLQGDVNIDGSVSIADVTALVNIILGKEEDEFGMADVNEDGEVTIADVTTLVNIILGR